MNLSAVNPAQLLAAARVIMNDTRSQVDPPLRKIERMQDLYLAQNANLYTADQTVQIRRWLGAMQYKYLATHVHLEELWTLSMTTRWTLLELLEQAVERQNWTNSDLTIGSMYLENFLLQGRSFLNFYMFYTCLIMNIASPGSITIDAFQAHMRKVKGERFVQRAQAIGSYFETTVFGNGQWGRLIKDLRDKITHRENLRPSNQGDEVILGILLDWPTIRGMTFERFGQIFANGMFEMIRATTPLLFELDRQATPAQILDDRGRTTAVALCDGCAALALSIGAVEFVAGDHLSARHIILTSVEQSTPHAETGPPGPGECIDCEDARYPI